MTLSEMVRACAAAMEAAEEFKIDPGLTLVWPKGLGRFPMHGELMCVNASEERVYRVRVADALFYVSKILKAAHPVRANQGANSQ